MITLCLDYPMEPYKAYKNRAVKKHIDKATNQLMQIRQCSLKGDDKIALIKKIIEIFNKQ